MSIASAPAARFGWIIPAVLWVVMPCAARGQPGRQAWTCLGRVTASDGAPIGDAHVSIAPATDSGRSLGYRTAADGRYGGACPPRVGGYVFRVTRIGFLSQWHSVGGTTNDSLRVDFVLKPIAQQLAAIETDASRPLVAVRTNGQARLPGSDVVDVSTGGGGDALQDLSAALAMTPDITLTPDGLSAFGSSPDQMGATLNGMPSGASIPRDGLQPSLYLSTYDPRQGHSVGPQLAYTLPSGTGASARYIHVTGQDVHLTRPSLATFSSPTNHNIVSGTASGPLPWSNTYYSSAFQIEHQYTQLTPLDAASPALLAAVRLEPDSVENLLSIARALGLPTEQRPQTQQIVAGSLASRIDLTSGAADRQIDAGAAPQDQLYVLFDGGWRTSRGNGLSPSASASTASSTRQLNGQLLSEYVTYKLAPFTSDSKLSIATSSNDDQPMATLPQASIFVPSQSADGSAGLTPLALGGDAGLATHQHDIEATGNSDLSWYTWNRSHRFDVFAQADVERYRAQRSANPYGIFSFNSANDFSHSTAASFSRSLGTEVASLGVTRLTAALSDIVAPGHRSEAPSTYDPGLMLQYGLRADYERYDPRPPAASPLAQRFGLSPGRIPSALALQPMIGFTWNPSQYRARAGDFEILRSRNTISGGLREYRGLVGTSTLADIAGRTGGPTGMADVYCVGDAVPSPLWRAYVISPSAIPVSCAGNASSIDAQVTPSAAAFSPDFTPPERWTGRLALEHEFDPSVTATVAGTVSRITHLSDPVDVNFNGVARGELAAEKSRPIFVSWSSIVASSGAVSFVESRRTSDYGRVVEWQSDLTASQQQATVGIKYGFGSNLLVADVAGIPEVAGTIGVSYTLAGGSVEQRGFTGSTAGDPLIITSGRQPTATHTVRVLFTLRRPTWFSLSATAIAASGFAYTPIVGSDINGDGAANDRAFVFDPTLVPDSSLAKGLTTLLRNSSASARACLLSQLNTIARRNSCRGPWSLSIGTIALQLDPYRIHLEAIS